MSRVQQTLGGAPSNAPRGPGPAVSRFCVFQARRLLVAPTQGSGLYLWEITLWKANLFF